jgi:tetratricopeptide (TPR) repeat protein
LVKAGEYGQAEEILKKVLNLAMQLKANRVDTLSRAFQDLTTLYCQMARWPEAEEYCLRAISAMEEPGTAAQRLLPATLEQLASIYAHQRNFTSFDLALEKSAELHAVQLGESSPEAAAKYLEFARRAESENRFKVASKLYRVCLTKVEDALGHQAEPVAQIHFLLGAFSEKSDRVDEAILSYRTALQVNEKIFGGEDPKVVPALEALAHAFIKQGAPAKAIEALERALKITEEEQGPYGLDVGRLLIPMAECALATGSVAVAEETAVNAVRILERDQDPALHQALAIAGRAKVAAGEAKAADSLFSNAISLLQQAVGTTHPEVARYLDGRAEAAELLGKSDEAQRWRSRAVEIRQACTA